MTNRLTREQKDAVLVATYFDIFDGYDNAIERMETLIADEPTKHLRMMYAILRDGFEEDRESLRMAYETMFIENME